MAGEMENVFLKMQDLSLSPQQSSLNPANETLKGSRNWSGGSIFTGGVCFLTEESVEIEIFFTEVRSIGGEALDKKSKTYCVVI